MNIDIMKFYKGKNVLVTGHTGFKGSWMTSILLMAGANVTGYSLKPPTNPSLYEVIGLDNWDYEVTKGQANDKLSSYGGKLKSVYGDVRNLELLKETFAMAKPEIVIHMAAQPIVRESYVDPVGTYETNVIGTVNVLECCRLTDSVKSVVNVTTDKVYRNYERQEGYVEDEELCGYDPYSNSKSCSELVTDSYRNSFLRDKGVVVTTMRAGNVIGGGDFAKDRIIPDCVRAAIGKEDIVLRNPNSTRPYQHVLEPVVCYLKVAAMQLEDNSIQGAYNVGPDESDALTTGNIATMFCKKWNELTGDNVKYLVQGDGGPHEANYLKLDCSKIKSKLGWKPIWNANGAIDKLVEWYASYAKNENMTDVTIKQINEYLG